MFPALQEGVVGFGIVCFDSGLRRLFFGREIDRERGNNFLSDLILHGKDIIKRSVVALRPHMSAGGCIDELGVDPHLFTGTAHAAF